MTIWNYDKCDLCLGTGTLHDKRTCPVCKGEGLWEFVVEDNEQAVRFLADPTAVVSERAKEICTRRIDSLNPDTAEKTLRSLQEGSTDKEFDQLQLAGATRWGWAWLHTNRFAIALCRLNGLPHIPFAFALSRMSWNWLEEEKQEKVDAST